MKNYNVKYSIGQEVYFLHDNKVICSPVRSIKITEFTPFNLFSGGVDSAKTQDAKEGICIEYVLLGDNVSQSENHCLQAVLTINQRNIYPSKEELIASI